MKESSLEILLTKHVLKQAGYVPNQDCHSNYWLLSH